MKYFISLLSFSLLMHCPLLAQLSIEKLWITDTILPVPESVLYNKSDKSLFVSLIDGSPAERDGKGGIAILSSEGKIIDLNWITGLNAPKGMARYKNVLYVADLTELVVIDIKQRTVAKKIAIDSAVVLNDVTVDGKGIVYVSDPRAKKVFRVENNTASVYLNQLIKPNGLKVIGKFLYMLDNGSLYKIDKQKNKKLLVEGLDDNTDGIEPVKKGEFIVTCWTGVIYHVTESGSNQVLLDRRKEEYYTADIGYDSKTKTVYVPSLFKKTITAYAIK